MTGFGEWRAGSLQAALFLEAPAPKGLEIFSSLTGEAPASVDARPREALVRESGVVAGKQLHVNITPLRVDILRSPVEEPLAPDVELANISLGEFEAEVSEFADLVIKWIPTFAPPVVRVALVSVVLAEAETRAGAYELLAEKIKALSVTSEMHDLNYRINWKASSTLLPEGYINRITMWSAFSLKMFAGTAGQSPHSMGERHFARLDLDVNTPVERLEALPKESLPAMFEQFKRLAVENVSLGEIK